MIPAKRCLKKSQPRKAMLKGFTNQFTNRTIRIPFGRRPTSLMAEKSIRSIIG